MALGLFGTPFALNAIEQDLSAIAAQQQANPFTQQQANPFTQQLGQLGVRNLAAYPLAAPGAPFAPYMAGPSPDATQRARALLSRLLSPGQRRQWAAHGSFIEKGSDGRSYVLDLGGVHRINNETGERREYLCTIPELEPGAPPEDAIIARLLHLRSDAAGLRRKANTVRLPG